MVTFKTARSVCKISWKIDFCQHSRFLIKPKRRQVNKSINVTQFPITNTERQLLLQKINKDVTSVNKISSLQTGI